MIACFRCKPTPDRSAETPWTWSEPRGLCPSHSVTPRLRDGQTLESVLDRAAQPDSPLEGSLPGWIFKPVLLEIDVGSAIKGWADFAAGGTAVFEDRFAAKSHFEFRAFEVARNVDLLYVLHGAAADRAPIATLAEIVAVIGAVTPRLPPHIVDSLRGPAEGLRDLLMAWNFQIHLDRVRFSSGKPWPDSFTELREWTVIRPNDAEQPAHGTEGSFVTALRSLSVRRFPGTALLAPYEPASGLS